MAKIGDIVRYLNAVGGGRITRIKDNVAYVDDDGFETPVLLREIVVVRTAEEENRTALKPRENVVTPPPVAPVPTKDVTPVVEEEPVEEVDGGDILNLTIAFEPQELKHLSDTVYACYFVNDSNYYVYVVLLSKCDDAQGWTTRYAGIAEPNFQILLGDFHRDEVARFDKLAVQYIAFKRDKEFELKLPASVIHSIDTTKFFKLHCFRESPYFDNPVLAFNIVSDDKPVTEQTKPDAARLKDAMLAKKRIDRHPVRKNMSKSNRKDNSPLVVDLHIHELIDNTHGLSNADMLNLQVDKFREVMDANLRFKGKKIVFIHGKGEGVLRNALMKELNHRYKGHDVQDASFREYGFGATQVTIR